MSFPEIFYRVLTLSQSALTDTPGGTLVIEEFIRGNPNFWRNHKAKTLMTPKKLVLCDWKIKARSKESLEKLQVAIHALQEAEFSIYVHQADGIVRLEAKSPLEMQEVFSELKKTPIEYPEKVVEKAMEQYGFVQDEVHALDGYWVDVLLDGENAPSAKQVWVTDLKIIEPSDLEQFCNILKNNPCPVEELIDDLFSAELDETVKDILHHIPALKVKQQIQHVSIYHAHLCMLLDTGSLTIGKKTLVKDDLKNIKVLEIDGETSGQSLAEDAIIYLRDCVFPNLERLDLGRFGPMLLTDAFQGHSFPGMQEFDLAKMTLKPDEIERIFNLFPNLMSVYFHKVTILSGKPNLDKSCFKSMHKFIAESATISMDFICELINAAPELERLQLHQLEDNLENHVIEQGSLQFLKNLRIRDASLKAKTFVDIVNHSPNLTDLITENITYIDAHNTPDFQSNPKLALVKLTSNFVHGRVLTQFCQTHTEIKHLNLADTDNYTDEITIPPQSMGKLTGLCFEDLTFSATNLATLINASNGIASIKFNDTQTEDAVSFTQPGLMPLENFICEDSDWFNLQHLEQILNGCTSLHYLELEGVTLEGMDINLPRQGLPNIEHIIINGLSMSEVVWEKLLKACFRLKHLSLVNIDVPLENIIIPGCLNDLEELEYSYSCETTKENIISVLNRLPALQKFTYYNSQMIPRISKLKKMFPKIEFDYVDDEQSNPEPHVTQSQGIPEFKLNASAHIKPLPKRNFVFKYGTVDKNYHQNYIIHQLSQYLVITNHNESMIADLREGICETLSVVFCELDMALWNNMIKRIHDWDGTKENLSEGLKADFQMLMTSVEKEEEEIRKSTLIADNLGSFLATNTQSCVLGNQWHAIAIKPAADGSWMLYDPNISSGIQFLQKPALEKLIIKVLGTVVSYIGEQPQMVSITNCDAFIRNGGLLELYRVDNLQQVLDILTQHNQYSIEALETLFFRNVQGRPTWILTMFAEDLRLSLYILSLITQLLNQKTESINQFKESLDCVSEELKITYIKRLLEFKKKKNTLSALDVKSLDSLIQILVSTPSTVNYTATSETWYKPKALWNSIDEYAKNCLQSGPVKKLLVECVSMQELDAIRLSLEQNCIKSRRVYRYIDKPSDLICSADFIQRKYNKAIRRAGPGGPMYDFLQKFSNKREPVLIINYDNFSNEDIIRFLLLLNQNSPKLDGVDVPDDLYIIGLRRANKPGAYKGSVFLSRFNRIEKSAFSWKKIQDSLPANPFVQTAPDSAPVIELYHGQDWKEKLLGSWRLTDKGFVYKDGFLKTALVKSSTIVIKNGLWEDRKFNQFWQEAFTRGYFEGDDRQISVPENFKIVRTEGYDWVQLKNYIKPVPMVTNYKVLNPVNQNLFIQSFHCDNATKTLFEQPGFIAQKAKEHHLQHKKRKHSANRAVIPVYLTADLDLDNWARLLDECRDNDVDLEIACAPKVNLPDVWGFAALPAMHLNPPTELPPNTTAVIFSTDPDTTISRIKAENGWQVFDISESLESDLLQKINGGFNNDEVRPEFTQSKGALTKALDDGESVILTGEYSPELILHLTALLAQRIQLGDKATGRLVIVTSNKEDFSCMPIKEEIITTDDKLQQLGIQNEPKLTSLLTYLDTEPLSKLQARKEYLLTHPEGANSDALWEGMFDLDLGVIDLGFLDLNLSAEQAEAFKAWRLQSVLSALNTGHYVFLAGLSGAGKTTFVLKELKQYVLLHVGKEAIKNWALDRTDGLCVLFIDEATLAHGDLTMFEGLYNDPPFILIGNLKYPLTKNHKVVFAGNPICYGDERTLPKFLKRHGQSLVFNVLPRAVVYEDIIKPVFEQNVSAFYLDDFGVLFTDVYAFILSCSKTDVLISPREIQMMAIMTLSMMVSYPEEDPLSIANYWAYQLGKDLVPDEKRSEFDMMFAPSVVRKPKLQQFHKDFLNTHTRFELTNILSDLLVLRSQRQSYPSSKAFSHGGLGGLIVEGESSTGKLDFISKFLEAEGFTEVKDFTIPANSKQYYRIYSSMPVDVQKEIYLKAAEEGAIVFREHFNGSSLLEDLQNDLLMGKVPGKDEPPKPGFLLLGVQNSTKEPGRRALSTALARRVIQLDLPPYSAQEMIDILVFKGLDTHRAEKLVSAYELNLAKAKAENLHPKPCFRNILSMTERLLDMDKKRLAASIEKSVVRPRRDSRLKPKSPTFKKTPRFFQQHVLPQPLPAVVDAIQANPV